jgi:hypothetical protein
MADRIRPVHSSSRPRTRALTMQFGRSFSLLRRRQHDHEFVIAPGHATDTAVRIWDGS